MALMSCACFGGSREERSSVEAPHIPSQSVGGMQEGLDEARMPPSDAGTAAQQPPLLDSRDHSFASASYMHRFSTTLALSPNLGIAARRAASMRAASLPGNTTPLSIGPSASSNAAAAAIADTAASDVGAPSRVTREASWVSRSFLRSFRGVEAVVAKMRRRRAAEDGSGANRRIEHPQSSMNSRTDDGPFCAASASHDRTTGDTAIMYSESQLGACTAPHLETIDSLPTRVACAVDSAAVAAAVAATAFTATGAAAQLQATSFIRQPDAAERTPAKRHHRRHWQWLLCINVSTDDTDGAETGALEGELMAQACAEMRAIADTMLTAAAAAQEAATAAAAAARAVEAQYAAIMAVHGSTGLSATVPPHLMSISGSPDSVVKANLGDEQSPGRHSAPGVSGIAKEDSTVSSELVQRGGGVPPHVAATHGAMVGFAQMPPDVGAASPFHGFDKPAVHGMPFVKAGLGKRTTSSNKIDLYRGLAIRLNKMSSSNSQVHVPDLTAKLLYPQAQHPQPQAGVARSECSHASPTISIATPSRRGLRYTLAASSSLPADCYAYAGNKGEEGVAEPDVAHHELATAVSAPPRAMDICGPGGRRCTMDVYDWDFGSQGFLSSQGHASGENTIHEGSPCDSENTRGYLRGHSQDTLQPALVSPELAVIGGLGTPRLGGSSPLAPSPWDASTEAPPGSHPQRLTASVLSQLEHATYMPDQQALMQYAPGHGHGVTCSVAPDPTASHLAALHRARQNASHASLGLPQGHRLPGTLTNPRMAAPVDSPGGGGGGVCGGLGVMRHFSVSSSGVPPGPALVMTSQSGLSFSHNRSRFCDAALGARSTADGGALSPNRQGSSAWPQGGFPSSQASPDAGGVVGAALCKRGSGTGGEYGAGSSPSRVLYGRHSDSGSLPCNSSLVRSDTAGSDSLMFSALGEALG